MKISFDYNGVLDTPRRLQVSGTENKKKDI
jgi:hypothetical protein